MPTAENAICPRQRAYRRRLAAAGEQEVLFRLSNETVALIDEIKERQGLRNRGQVLEQLIEIRRTAAQQQ
jgi:Ribbon-helix-helix protein, copG family